MRCNATVASQFLVAAGFGVSESTAYRKRQVELAAAADEVAYFLEHLPASQVVCVGMDNCGKQQGAHYQNGIVMWAWTLPGLDDNTKLPAPEDLRREVPAVRPSDREAFERQNPVFGEHAFSEELTILHGGTIINITTAGGDAIESIFCSERLAGSPPPFPICFKMTDKEISAPSAKDRPVPLPPVPGNVTLHTVREALHGIAKHLKIGPDGRRFIYLVCDQDVAAYIGELSKQAPNTWDWIRLVPAQWHVSLCVRLTIGATWGKTDILIDAVRCVESTSEKAAKYLLSGVRWRRSGVIFYQLARGMLRALLQKWLNEGGQGEARTHDAWARFAAWQREQFDAGNALVKFYTDFIRAVGRNLALDLAMRKGDYDECVKLAHQFHALACNRGRHNYKELLGEQIIKWAEEPTDVRELIERAAFTDAQNGFKISRDEAYEAMIKLVKAHLQPGHLADHNFVSAAMQASHYMNLEERLQSILDWLHNDLHVSPARASSRPQSASTATDREKIAAYTKLFAKQLAEYVPGTPIKLRDGTS